MLLPFYLKIQLAAWRARVAPRSRPDGRRIVVYTVLTGGYDLPTPLAHRDAGVDYVLLTDDPASFAPGWTTRPLPAEVAGLDPKTANRWCKIFPHRIFPDHDMTIYLDANITFRGSADPLIAEFLSSGAGLGLFPHPFNRTVRAEFDTCRHHAKFTAEDLALAEAQLRRYAAEGSADEEMLTENGVIFRDNASAGMRAAMDLWWAEFAAGVKRDQVSLPSVRRVTGVPCHVWPVSYRAMRTVFGGPFPHFSEASGRRFARLRYRRKVAKSLQNG